MPAARRLWAISSLVFVLHATVRPLSAQEKAQPKLWIGIAVSKPAYSIDETARLQVFFAVVNDGESVVNPGIGSSHLFINGVEPQDWSFVINNGLRTPQFTALQPGDVLSFGYQLGPRYFAKPGQYVLRWQVGTFRSAETTFRVLPRQR